MTTGDIGVPMLLLVLVLTCFFVPCNACDGAGCEAGCSRHLRGGPAAGVGLRTVPEGGGRWGRQGW